MMPESLDEQIRVKAEEFCGSGALPGYLAGVYQGGGQSRWSSQGVPAEIAA
jgi:hypothetical protein